MQTKIVTRAIIVDDEGKVLLGKRNRKDGVGKWALIGGKPEGAETPEETIIREVNEETGLNFIPTLFKEETDLESVLGEEWKVYYYFGNFTGDLKIKEDELAEVTYISESDLDGLDITFGHDRILKEYFKSLRS